VCVRFKINTFPEEIRTQVATVELLRMVLLATKRSPAPSLPVRNGTAGKSREQLLQIYTTVHMRGRGSGRLRRCSSRPERVFEESTRS
jgi:hypothetical protein